jgi:hypothetical protein
MAGRLSFEREFLKLAGTWLKCRYRVMHGDALIGCPIPFDLPYDFLGCNDSWHEMRLLCVEMKENR